MGHYVIRVQGLLSPGLTAAFPALHATQQLQTLLHGPLRDQSSLTHVLDRLQGAGVRVIGVRRIAGADCATAVDEGQPALHALSSTRAH